MRRLVVALAAVSAIASGVPAAAWAVAPPTPVSGLPIPRGCLVETDFKVPGCTTSPGLRDAAYLAVSPDSRFVYVTGRSSYSLMGFVRDRLTGALTPIKGKGGCAAVDPSNVVGRTCFPSAPLARPTEVVISSDGKFIYTAGENSDTIGIFKRNLKTGTFTAAGCIGGDRHPAGCDAIPLMRDPAGLSLTPDGKQLYVANFGTDTVIALQRNAASGGLAFAACARRNGATSTPVCADLPGSTGATRLTVSHDGKNVYVTATLDNSVIALARDPATGAMTAIGCVSGRADGKNKAFACTSGRGLVGPQTVTESPDGRNVYVTALGSSIAILNRDPATGALTQAATTDGCLQDVADGTDQCALSLGLSQPYGFAFDSTGTTAYVGEFGHGALTAYRRDPATGLLTRMGPCYADDDPDCTPRKPIAHAGYVVVTPDGRDVLLDAPGSNVVQIFGRSADAPIVALGAKTLVVKKGKTILDVQCPKYASLGCFGDGILRAMGADGRPAGKGVPFTFDLDPTKRVHPVLKLDARTVATLKATKHDIVQVDITSRAPGGATAHQLRWRNIRVDS